MKYYLLRDDINFPNRWYLGDVAGVDNWMFIDPSNEFSEKHFTVSLYRDGEPMDYTVNNAFGVPIVSEYVAEMLRGCSDLQFFPVAIKGKSVRRNFYIMFVKSKADCVDEERSEFQKYELDDPVRPDKAGQYRSFFNLVVNSRKLENFNVVRVNKSVTRIVVSEKVKEIFENNHLTGAVFESVNGDQRTVA